ncbi:MAG: menaquinone biosynthesis protein, partial [Candidatus Omnitrophica bacterium]|nr:menaquinone biosynthesis protein [Candidatus Omnitrophota bacterium]
NTFPYVYGLGKQLQNDSSVQFYFGTPADLNKKMAQGGLDIALLSSIELTRHADRYGGLTDLGIGVRESAGSVLFFSQVPLEQLAKKTIAVTSASATGAALLRLLLRRCWGIEGVNFQRRMNLNGIRDRFPAVLVIGDEALQAKQQWPSRWTCYDLGGIWTEWTGLPFVFALWTYSREWGTARPVELRAVSQRLKEAVEYSRLHWSEMVTEAEKRWSGIKEVGAYLRRFDYALESSYGDGLVTFYQWVKRMGEEENHVHIPAVAINS